MLRRRGLSRCVQKHKGTQDRRAGAVSIVINPWRAPDLGVGDDVGDSSSPYAQGKHRPARGCHAPERKHGSRPGPHLHQNVLARCAAVAPASILGPVPSIYSSASPWVGSQPCGAKYPGFCADSKGV